MFVERVSPSSNSIEVRLRRLNDNSSINDAMIFLNCAVATESTDREGGLYKVSIQETLKCIFYVVIFSELVIIKHSRGVFFFKFP